MPLNDELKGLERDALITAYADGGGVFPKGINSFMEIAEPLMPEYPALGVFVLRLLEEAMTGDNPDVLLIAAGAAMAFRTLIQAGENLDTPHAS